MTPAGFHPLRPNRGATNVRRLQITPADDQAVTAREALEPLCEKLELEADMTVLHVSFEVGWSPDEATGPYSD